MADKLIIVESPAKANTIKKFLGGNTKVVASMGHIRDLPKSKLGVDIEHDFEPEYINIRGKGDLIKSLKKEAKRAKIVYLATDPDREGEAIAWHLAHILDIPEDSICRVTFNEITKEAVKTSIKNPRKIDKNLTDAQQARRVLDRIVGYKISPILWKKVKTGLSAGRVQSVAVKLIVDRENEIENFKPEEYWNIYANLLEEKSKKSFIAKFYGKDGKKVEIHSKEEVDEILKNINNEKFIVDDVKRSQKKRNPSPPFTTSTMQQEASRKINFTLKKTMSVAQGLYEGVKVEGKGTIGLITYMRTDSTRISEEARRFAKEHIVSKYGENYYENRYFKTKDNSQDAHEAIRPTYIELEPDKIKESLTNDQYKLYKLIYNRFIASQMAAAVYDTVSASIGVNSYLFKANGQNLKFKGFMTLYVETLDNEEDSENTTIPELEKNQEVVNQKEEKLNKLIKMILPFIDDIKIENNEILVKGDIVMLGYYRDEQATKSVIKKGYFNTGDFGYLDENGFLYITGRKKNLIILSNGENISPEVIEEKLSKDKGVCEVIVYAKDNKLIAMIYPNEEYFGNTSYFNGLIYKYNSKVPKNHQISSVTLRNDEFPKNNNRKIMRNKIMEEEKCKKK